MPDIQQTSIKQIDDIGAYHKLEIQEVFNSIRTVNTLRIQVYSFFGTANVTILAVALNQKNAVLILLAACTMGVLILVDNQLRRYFDVLVSRGVELEDMYAVEKERAYLHRYVGQSSYSSGRWIQRHWLAFLVLIAETIMAILSWRLVNW